MSTKRKTKKKTTKKKAKKSFKLKKNVRMKSLEAKNMPKVRAELLDADYLKQLSEDELRWYAQFTDEYVGANIQKTKAGKVKAGYLHSTKELAKDCYDRNNRRNYDIYSVSRANGLLYDVERESNENDGWYITNSELTEDALISDLEKQDSDDSILSFEEFLRFRDNLTEEVRNQYEKIYAKELRK